MDGVAARFTQEGGKLRIRPAAPIDAGGTFEVRVAYGGVPTALPDPTAADPSSALPLGWISRGRYSYVVSEPVGASNWFPVNDEVTDKATYRIAVTVDAPYDAVSNGQLERVDELGARRRFVWNMAAPMASWLAIVHIDRYRQERVRTQKGLTIRTYTTDETLPETAAAIRKTPEMLAYFESLVGPYPFRSYGSVVVRDPDLY